jgi:hypothetical protein
MNNIDFNLNNYTIKDIINLFKITYDLSLNEMKQAKKIVLKLHPDKSGLDSSYYIFYADAYKMLLKIYEFKNKSDINGNKNNTEYNGEYDINEDNNTNNKNALKHYFKQHDIENNSTKFNEWFNKQFEKGKILTHFDKTGYGDWLQSNDDFIKHDTAKNIDDISIQINRSKLAIKGMVVDKPIIDTYSSNMNASLLSSGDSTVSNFSSDIFSNFTFQDLKEAHVESIIPITSDVYKNKKKYTSIDDCIIQREQTCKPMSNVESNDFLNKQHEQIDNEGTHNAFNMIKDYEQQLVKNNIFWNDIKTLKYK